MIKTLPPTDDFLSPISSTVFLLMSSHSCPDEMMSFSKTPLSPRAFRSLRFSTASFSKLGWCCSYCDWMCW